MTSIKARATAGILQRGPLRTAIKDTAFICEVKLTLEEDWGLFNSRFRIGFSGEKEDVKLAASRLRKCVEKLGGEVINA